MPLNTRQQQTILTKAKQDGNLFKRGADNLWHELAPSLNKYRNENQSKESGGHYKMIFQQWKHSVKKKIEKKSRLTREERQLYELCCKLGITMKVKRAVEGTINGTVRKTVNKTVGGEHIQEKSSNILKSEFSNPKPTFTEKQYKAFLKYVEANPKILIEDTESTITEWIYVTDILAKLSQTPKKNYRQVIPHFKEWIWTALSKNEYKRKYQEKKMCKIWINAWTEKIGSEDFKKQVSAALSKVEDRRSVTEKEICQAWTYFWLEKFKSQKLQVNISLALGKTEDQRNCSEREICQIWTAVWTEKFNSEPLKSQTSKALRKTKDQRNSSERKNCQTWTYLWTEKFNSEPLKEEILRVLGKTANKRNYSERNICQTWTNLWAEMFASESFNNRILEAEDKSECQRNVYERSIYTICITYCREVGYDIQQFFMQLRAKRQLHKPKFFKSLIL
ncbi:hypothetical protein Trydic_g11841 [Trypoxylus dichotomus]